MNNISQAVNILKKGGTVVYPTDTAYGLAVDATNTEAVKKLYRLKGRDFKNPVHIIFPHTKWLKVVKLNLQALKLMNKFFPGPLTIVLPLLAKGKSWQMLSAGTKTMGIRYPANSVSQKLVAELGRPITTTSANISGLPTCYSVTEVKKQFESSVLKPDFYVDSGKLPRKSPSTVVSLVSDRAKIIRQGPISETQIKKCLSSRAA